MTFQRVRVLNLPWWPHHRRRDLETARHPRGRHHVVLRKVSPPHNCPQTTRDTRICSLADTLFFYFFPDKIFFFLLFRQYYFIISVATTFYFSCQRACSEKNLRDFAGNAMTTTVVGAAMLAALVVATDSLPVSRRTLHGCVSLCVIVCHLV